MGGCEVLSAVRAALQLIGGATQIAEAILTLPQQIRQLSERINSCIHQLRFLGKTLEDIKENIHLHTPLFKVQVQSVSTKVQSLNDLLQRSYLKLKQPLFQRVILVFTIKKLENLIIANFADIESDKNSLTLYITASCRKALGHIQHLVETSTSAGYRLSCECSSDRGNIVHNSQHAPTNKIVYSQEFSGRTLPSTMSNSDQNANCKAKRDSSTHKKEAPTNPTLNRISKNRTQYNQFAFIGAELVQRSGNFQLDQNVANNNDIAMIGMFSPETIFKLAESHMQRPRPPQRPRPDISEPEGRSQSAA